MKLYAYWRSSCSWRVRTALNLKGLPYTLQRVNLLKDGGDQNTESYAALNPSRTVPLLELEEGGKVHRIGQSLAILEYLEERYPAPPLLPNDALARARVRMLAELVNSGIQPLQNLSVLNRIKDELHADEKAWAKYWIDRGLAAFQRMAEPHAGRYCEGNQVTFADLCLVPQLFHARRFEIDLAPYGLLTRIESACAELPAFQAAHAEKQPDAP